MEGNRKKKDPLETEEMQVDISETLPTQPKWPPNVNKRPEQEKFAVSSLPPSVLLRQVQGAMFPVYTLNVRVLGIEPAHSSELQFVRGHCPYYSCNSIITPVNWAEAGPLAHGKLARPFCPECCQTRRKRYLNLYFHLELLVEDNLGQVTKIIVTREEAVRFLGLTVYRFLVSSKRRENIKEMLDVLLEASNTSRSAAVPGFTFDVRIMPVAEDTNDQVQFYLYGDNPPLFELSKRCRP